MKPDPGRSSHLLALQEHAHNTKTRRSRPFSGSQCNASESAMSGGLSLTSHYITNKLKLLLTACPRVSTEVSEHHGYFWKLCTRFWYLTVEFTFHNLHGWVAARNFLTANKILSSRLNAHRSHLGELCWLAWTKWLSGYILTVLYSQLLVASCNPSLCKHLNSRYQSILLSFL